MSEHKIPRYTIETPPYAKGRIELDEDGALCTWEEVETRLQDCIDELKSISENAVSDCALESINCVIEDLMMFQEKE